MAGNGIMQKMTKAEIIENIHEKSRLDKDEIQNVIDRFYDELKAAMQNDRILELRGLGTFEVRTRRGRESARNPKTGEIVPVKTHGVIFFRPGKELKEIAWGLRK